MSQVKRLTPKPEDDGYDEFISASAKLKKPEKGSVYVTKPYGSDQEAIDWKMKQLHPKLLGLWCPMKYTIKKKEKVYVPYTLFVFDYELRRGSNPGGKLDRTGQIGVIFDMNQVHSFHFDLIDDLGLQKKTIANLSGPLLPKACSDEEALANAEETVKSNYLRKVFAAIPIVTLKNKVPFYREAWKLDLECKGTMYEKYAYMDVFDMSNEYISGLKVRLDI
ncbi:MAG: hypothetical protein IJI74_03015 [Firmicutes bacterium]|nr:hypothetical protein [Bacillota bacterium]